MLHHKSAQQAQTLDRPGGGGDRRDGRRILWPNQERRRQARFAEDATLESPVRSDIREGSEEGRHPGREDRGHSTFDRAGFHKDRFVLVRVEVRHRPRKQVPGSRCGSARHSGLPDQRRESTIRGLRPMIGTISTADPMESYLSWLPGPHGGNMDLGQITVGATVYLPVRVDGALLHIGDVHAVQGDGELSGAAVEMPARTRLKIDVIRTKAIEWPRLEDDSTLYAVAATQAARSLDAMRMAFMNLILWLETDYSVDRWLAFGLLTLVSQVRIGNFWTVAVGVPKKYLNP